MNEHGSINEVLHSIRSHERILVTSHLRPDGDAVGSMLALGFLLRAMGKSPQLVLADPVPVLYRTLPGANTIRGCADLDPHFDTAIVLECDSVERTGISALASYPIINIDHHASAKLFGAVNWIDPSASAVAEMVYHLAIAAGVDVTPDMATCLYTAVLTDTGSFSYEAVSARTFQLAGELVSKGASPGRIAERIYFSNPESKIRLLGSALATLKIDNGIATLFVTKDDMHSAQATDADCEGVVNYAIGIKDVRVAFFLREIDGGLYRISMRSKGGLNVAAVAENFGGGGHRNARGCTVAGPLHEAVSTLVHKVRPLL
jgi:phosphoesterase RecJ-like protein